MVPVKELGIHRLDLAAKWGKPWRAARVASLLCRADRDPTLISGGATYGTGGAGDQICLSIPTG